MSSPVQLSDLPAAGVALDSDLTLLRSGLTDYQCTVAKIRAIDLSGFPSLVNPPQATDLMLIQASGSDSSSQVYFGQVGFTQGTQMWFYQDVAPTFWQAIAVGDGLLAVKGGSQAYNVNGGNAAGTWQQADVGGVAGQGLTIAQMPAHTHTTNTLINTLIGGNGNPDLFTKAQLGGQSGSTGSSSGTNGTSQAHNHGNTWRPYAAVGILCLKTS